VKKGKAAGGRERGRGDCRKKPAPPSGKINLEPKPYFCRPREESKIGKGTCQERSLSLQGMAVGERRIIRKGPGKRGGVQAKTAGVEKKKRRHEP